MKSQTQDVIVKFHATHQFAESVRGIIDGTVALFNFNEEDSGSPRRLEVVWVNTINCSKKTHAQEASGGGRTKNPIRGG